MSYSTNTEVIARIGSTNLASLHGAESPDNDLLTASRSEAAATMDRYLASVVMTPANTVEHPHLLPMLRNVEIAIVRRAEYARADTAELPALVTDDYDRAMAWLEDVRARKISLWPGTGRAQSLDLLRGDAQESLRCYNAEFNHTTEAGSGTVAMEVGDTGQTAGFVANAAGAIYYMAFACRDALTDGSAELQVTFNGEAIDDSDYVLTWDPSTPWGRLYWDSGIGFYEGELIGLNLVKTGSVPASKDLKAFLAYYYG